MSIVEINGLDLRNYLKSSKSIRFTAQGCKIRPKLGNIVLDLHDFDADECSVFINKISGNGRFRLNSVDYTVNSKISQKFDIDVGETKTIELSRPKDGTGEICVSKLSFFANKKDSKLSQDWKSIIKKCGKYQSLRLVKGRLFAATGGYIEKGDLVTYVETDPPNSFKRSGNKLVFTGSCEITNLSTDRNARITQTNIDVYPSRGAPDKVSVPEQDNVFSTPTETTLDFIKKTSPDNVIISLYEHIVYESKGFKGLKPNTNKFAKMAKSGIKNYLVLRPNATCSFSIASLEPNSEYICIISGKKLNGNGRVHIGLSASDPFNGQAKDVVFPGHNANKHVLIKSGPKVSGKLQKIHLFKHSGDCTGDVIIDRIIIMENIGLGSAKNGMNFRDYRPKINKVESSKYHNVAVEDSNDPVFISTKKYAVYVNTKSFKMDDFSVNIHASTVSGTMWFNKIKSVLPNIKLSNDKNALSIGSVKNLRTSKIMWVDVFDGDLTDQDINQLRGAKKIISPSYDNINKIKEKLPDANIHLAQKPIPFIKGNCPLLFSKTDYVFFIDRCKKYTDLILNNWSGELPKIALLGVRGRFPNFVIPINEYLPYEELLDIITKSRCIIDFPKHSYLSSFLGIANSIGVPIVSSNSYISDKENCVFIDNPDEVLSNIKDVIKNTSKTEVKFSEKEYNAKFLDDFKDFYEMSQ